jgi:hypothetical protein
VNNAAGRSRYLPSFLALLCAASLCIAQEIPDPRHRLRSDQNQAFAEYQKITLIPLSRPDGYNLAYE